ncbi:hypothetical protein BKA66DRAFT_423517 [Pyrenochaeta sp. MPI-SDFR-AT-0127]|nr:hypothetical protein BKA66DRAFT_423517 [Pyrenochaeta sp. MPI-SDFR-AT-0127]
MEKWVQNEYRTRHCDQDGHLVGKVNLDTLRSALTKIRPNDAHAINDILKRLHIEICADICRNFEFNKQGEFKDTPAVHQRLLQARSDLKDGVVRRKAIIEHKAGRVVQTSTTSTVEMPQPSQSKGKANATPTTTQIPAGDNSLKIWIHSQYLEKGFRGSDFIGWKHLANALAQANPGRAEEIKTTLKE